MANSKHSLAKTTKFKVCKMEVVTAGKAETKMTNTRVRMFQGAGLASACLGFGKSQDTSPAPHNPGMVVPAYNLCIWEAKAGGSGIKGRLWPYIKSEASMH